MGHGAADSGLVLGADGTGARAVAEEFQAPFLRTLAEPGTFVREDTFDNCHFNERGSMRMAEEVFRFLEQRQLLPPSSRQRVAKGVA